MLRIYTDEWQIFNQNISEIIHFPVRTDFESVAQLWLREKNFKSVNTCTLAVIWTSWKSRNDLCFQGSQWTGKQKLMKRCEIAVQGGFKTEAIVRGNGKAKLRTASTRLGPAV